MKSKHSWRQEILGYEFSFFDLLRRSIESSTPWWISEAKSLHVFLCLFYQIIHYEESLIHSVIIDMEIDPPPFQNANTTDQWSWYRKEEEGKIIV